MEFEYLKHLKERGEDPKGYGKTNYEDFLKQGNYVFKGKIEGVEIRKLEKFVDDRGFLSEICRSDWEEIIKLAPGGRDDILGNLNQVYIVGNWSKGTVRAFHKHEKLVDFFVIVRGVAKFILFDDRPDSPTFGILQQIISEAGDLKMITVPSGVFHGWQSLCVETLLVSVANDLYMGYNKKEYLDEHRIPYDIFGKNIWEVEYK